MIEYEQMGNNSMYMGVSLASMTLDAVENVQHKNVIVEDRPENKDDKNI